MKRNDSFNRIPNNGYIFAVCRGLLDSLTDTMTLLLGMFTKRFCYL